MPTTTLALSSSYENFFGSSPNYSKLKEYLVVYVTLGLDHIPLTSLTFIPNLCVSRSSTATLPPSDKPTSQLPLCDDPPTIIISTESAPTLVSQQPLSSTLSLRLTRLLKSQDFQFIPFGTGRRGCPGMSFALATVEYVMANLLYWFDWDLPLGEVEENLDMSEVNGLVVHKKLPLHLVPTLYSPYS
ncbi:hypothetical protein WN943_014322 [Citrus x changshan-huyou]